MASVQEIKRLGQEISDLKRQARAYKKQLADKDEKHNADLEGMQMRINEQLKEAEKQTKRFKKERRALAKKAEKDMAETKQNYENCRRAVEVGAPWIEMEEVVDEKPVTYYLHVLSGEKADEPPKDTETADLRIQLSQAESKLKKLTAENRRLAVREQDLDEEAKELRASTTEMAKELEHTRKELSMGADHFSKKLEMFRGLYFTQKEKTEYEQMLLEEQRVLTNRKMMELREFFCRQKMLQEDQLAGLVRVVAWWTDRFNTLENRRVVLVNLLAEERKRFEREKEELVGKIAWAVPIAERHVEEMRSMSVLWPGDMPLPTIVIQYLRDVEEKDPEVARQLQVERSLNHVMKEVKAMARHGRAALLIPKSAIEDVPFLKDQWDRGHKMAPSRGIDTHVIALSDSMVAPDQYRVVPVTPRPQWVIKATSKRQSQPSLASHLLGADQFTSAAESWSKQRADTLQTYDETMVDDWSEEEDLERQFLSAQSVHALTPYRVIPPYLLPLRRSKVIEGALQLRGTKVSWSADRDGLKVLEEWKIAFPFCVNNRQVEESSMLHKVFCDQRGPLVQVMHEILVQEELKNTRMKEYVAKLTRRQDHVTVLEKGVKKAIDGVKDTVSRVKAEIAVEQQVLNDEREHWQTRKEEWSRYLAEWEKAKEVATEHRQKLLAWRENNESRKIVYEQSLNPEEEQGVEETEEEEEDEEEGVNAEDSLISAGSGLQEDSVWSAGTDNSQIEEAPVDSGEEEEAPVDSGEEEEAPVDSGEEEEAPVDSGEEEEAPVDSGEEEEASRNDISKDEAVQSDGGEGKEAPTPTVGENDDVVVPKDIIAEDGGSIGASEEEAEEEEDVIVRFLLDPLEEGKEKYVDGFPDVAALVPEYDSSLEPPAEFIPNAGRLKRIEILQSSLPVLEQTLGLLEQKLSFVLDDAKVVSHEVATVSRWEKQLEDTTEAVKVEIQGLHREAERHVDFSQNLQDDRDKITDTLNGLQKEIDEAGNALEKAQSEARGERTRMRLELEMEKLSGLESAEEERLRHIAREELSIAQQLLGLVAVHLSQWISRSEGLTLAVEGFDKHHAEYVKSFFCRVLIHDDSLDCRIQSVQAKCWPESFLTFLPGLELPPPPPFPSVKAIIKLCSAYYRKVTHTEEFFTPRPPPEKQGYRDHNNVWISTAEGHYDEQTGDWVDTAQGWYNSQNAWVPNPNLDELLKIGYYDEYGRWYPNPVEEEELEETVVGTEEAVGESNVESKDAVEESKDAVEGSKDAVEGSKDAVEDAVEESKDAVEESKDAVEESKDAVEGSKDAVEESKDAVEEPKDAVEESIEGDLRKKLPMPPVVVDETTEEEEEEPEEPVVWISTSYPEHSRPYSPLFPTSVAVLCADSEPVDFSVNPRVLVNLFLTFQTFDESMLAYSSCRGPLASGTGSRGSSEAKGMWSKFEASQAQATLSTTLSASKDQLLALQSRLTAAQSEVTRLRKSYANREADFTRRMTSVRTSSSKAIQFVRDEVIVIRKHMDMQIESFKKEKKEMIASQTAELTRQKELLDSIRSESERRSAWANTLQISLKETQQELAEARHTIVLLEQKHAKDLGAAQDTIQYEQTRRKRIELMSIALKDKIAEMKRIVKKLNHQFDLERDAWQVESAKIRREIWKRDETGRRLKMDADACVLFFVESISAMAGSSKLTNDRLGVNEMVGVMIALTGSARPEVSRQAARALGRMGWNGSINSAVRSHLARQGWRDWVLRTTERIERRRRAEAATWAAGVANRIASTDTSTEEGQKELQRLASALVDPSKQSELLKGASVTHRNNMVVAPVADTEWEAEWDWIGAEDQVGEGDENKGVEAAARAAVALRRAVLQAREMPDEDAVKTGLHASESGETANEANLSKISDTGGLALKSLLHLLKSSDVEAQMHVTDALGILALDTHARMLMGLSEECLQRLVTLCQEGEPDVQRNASAALCNIAYRNNDNQARLGRMGAVEALLDLCRFQNTIDDTSQAHAEDGIRDLDQRLDAKKVPARYDVDCLENATAALATLAALDENSERIGRAGGVTLLTSLCGSNAVSDCPRIAWHAAEALANATRVSETFNAEKVIESGIHPIIQLCANPEVRCFLFCVHVLFQKQVRRHAALVIGNIAQDDRLRQEAGVAGAVEALFLIADDAEDVIGQRNAMWALSNLAWCAYNQDRIGRYLPQLLDLCQVSSPMVRRCAAVALANSLFYHELNRTRLHSIPDSHHIIVKLLTDQDHQIVEHAARALGAAASNEVLANAFVTQGAVEHLLRLCQSSDATDKILRYAASALLNIAVHDSNKQSLLDAGAVDVMVKLHACKVADARDSADKALQLLGGAYEANSKQETMDYGVQGMIRLLSSGQPSIQSLAADKLSEMAESSPVEQDAVAESGGLEVMIRECVAAGDWLRGSLGSELWMKEKAQENAVSLGMTLSTISEDGVPQKDSEVSEIQLQRKGMIIKVLECIRAVVHGNESSKCRFRRSHGVEAVLPLTQSGAPDVQEAALSVLITASIDHAGIARGIIADGLDVLISLASNNQPQSTVRLPNLADPQAPSPPRRTGSLRRQGSGLVLTSRLSEMGKKPKVKRIEPEQFALDAALENNQSVLMDLLQILGPFRYLECRHCRAKQDSGVTCRNCGRKITFEIDLPREKQRQSFKISRASSRRSMR